MNNYQNDGVWMKPKRSKKIHLDEYDNEIDYLAIITGKQKRGGRRRHRKLLDTNRSECD